jgi:hypothetical protein
MVGTETVVNAISAELVSKGRRGKRWESNVSLHIPRPGGQHVESVVGQKGANYRILRTRLSNGIVDVAIVHSLMTVVEDTEQSFYLLSYEGGIPAGFFHRLNRVLSLPLKPEWEPWLWEQGQKAREIQFLEPRTGWESGGYEVKKLKLMRLSLTPITRLNGLGSVTGYIVYCSGRYKEAWLDIIRKQLQLGVVLKKAGPSEQEHCPYLNGKWAARPTEEGWTLYQEDRAMLTAPSLEWLLLQARTEINTFFILDEGGQL